MIISESVSSKFMPIVREHFSSKSKNFVTCLFGYFILPPVFGRFEYKENIARPPWIHAIATAAHFFISFGSWSSIQGIGKSFSRRGYNRDLTIMLFHARWRLLKFCQQIFGSKLAVSLIIWTKNRLARSGEHLKTKINRHHAISRKSNGFFFVW